MSDAPVWTRGELGMGPYACPVCGSVGTGRGMGHHLLWQHVVALAEDPELAAAALEAELYTWVDDNIVGHQIVGKTTLQAIKAQAAAMNIDCDPQPHPTDDRIVVLNVKGPMVRLGKA